jgi:short-subunit dehydrogenase
VYISGGSGGLGLSLAQLITKRGAHVSIVARNEERLNKALASLEVRSLLLFLQDDVRSLHRNYVSVQPRF